MYYKEHEPPHFHAEHQRRNATFDFAGQIRAGNIQSKRALRLIREWAILHGAELEVNWVKMTAGQPLDEIPPLEWVDEITSLPAVVRAEYRGALRIHLTFNDNSEATVDFQQWLDGPVFEPLKDPSYFRRFFIDGGTVVWPNGADIAPETLYDAVQATRSNPALQPTAPTREKGRGWAPTLDGRKSGGH